MTRARRVRHLPPHPVLLAPGLLRVRQSEPSQVDQVLRLRALATPTVLCFPLSLRPDEPTRNATLPVTGLFRLTASIEPRYYCPVTRNATVSSWGQKLTPRRAEIVRSSECAVQSPAPRASVLAFVTGFIPGPPVVVDVRPRPNSQDTRGRVCEADVPLHGMSFSGACGSPGDGTQTAQKAKSVPRGLRHYHLVQFAFLSTGHSS